MNRLLASLVVASVIPACTPSPASAPDTAVDADTAVRLDTSPETGPDADDPADTPTAPDSTPHRDSTGDTGTDADGADASETDPLACPPLDRGSGPTVRVSPDQDDNLPRIVREANPGTEILLEDGIYTPGGTLHVRADGVTLRSASDDATKVIIDGEYSVNEPIFINGSNVTIAHLTVRRAVDHPIHITPAGDAEQNVTGTLLYGLRLIDGGEQFVKVNPNGSRDAWVDDGRVECSHFEMTDQGRPHVERNPGGCYTGGIDMHSARGWVVRNNTFRDIYCAGEGLAEHAIHFWSASRGTLVENNRIVNCARGIGFGLVKDGKSRPYPDDPYPNAGHVGHYDGLIRNNVITADNPWYDTGIELAQARGARVYHNTVFSTDAATGFYSSIDYRFPNTDVEIRNNITRRITNRNNAQGTVDHNLQDPNDEVFVDLDGRDFHLADGATPAIDQGTTVDEAGIDIDGQTRDSGAGPDLGADEK